MFRFKVMRQGKRNFGFDRLNGVRRFSVVRQGEKGGSLISIARAGRHPTTPFPLLFDWLCWIPAPKGKGGKRKTEWMARTCPVCHKKGETGLHFKNLPHRKPKKKEVAATKGGKERKEGNQRTGQIPGAFVFPKRGGRAWSVWSAGGILEEEGHLRRPATLFGERKPLDRDQALLAPHFGGKEPCFGEGEKGEERTSRRISIPLPKGGEKLA